MKRQRIYGGWRFGFIAARTFARVWFGPWVFTWGDA